MLSQVVCWIAKCDSRTLVMSNTYIEAWLSYQLTKIGTEYVFGFTP